MDPGRCYDALFVGGGIAATMALRGLAHELSARRKRQDWRIAIIEPREELGRGKAWDDSHAMMLANMPTSDMGYYGAWDPARGLDLSTIHNLFPASAVGAAGQLYATRGEVGERLVMLHRETCAIASAQKISIDHARARAVRIERHADRYLVTLNNGELIETTAVVLALGLVPIDRYPHLGDARGYCGDGWDADAALAGLDRRERVVILGTGATATDLFVRLEDYNLFNPVAMVSRSGQLPAARPVLGSELRETNFSKARLRRWFEQGPFDPRTVDLTILAVLAEAGATPTDIALWEVLGRAGSAALLEATYELFQKPQPISAGLRMIDDLLPTIWRCSSEDARAHIMANWAKQNANYSFAIAPPNARVILDARREGRLITRGGLRTISRNDPGFSIELGTKGKTEIFQADRLINATGFEGPLDQSNNELVRTLMRDGLLVEAKFGGAEMDYDTGQVRGLGGDRIAGLFIAGGSLTRSAGYRVNAFADTTFHAIGVGMALGRHMQRPRPGTAALRRATATRSPTRHALVKKKN